MILRRVIAHFKKQEWTAIFLDFVIVVVGVFVGFQVTELAGRRSDRQAEAGHLEEISQDLRADQAMFEMIGVGARARIGAINHILGAARGEEPPAEIVFATESFDAPGDALSPETSRRHLLGWVNLVRTTRGNRTGYDALIGSGDLKLIRDRPIGHQIQRYYATLDDLWSTQVMLREIRNDGVTRGYELGLSAFGEIEEDRLIDIVRESDGYAAYLKTSREWAVIHLGLTGQQSAAAAALLESIDQYTGKGRDAP